MKQKGYNGAPGSGFPTGGYPSGAVSQPWSPEWAGAAVYSPGSPGVQTPQVTGSQQPVGRAGQNAYAAGQNGYAAGGQSGYPGGYAQTGNQGYAQMSNQGYAQMGNQGYAQTGNQSYAQMGNQGYAQTGNQGYAQMGNQGYAQTGNQGYPQQGTAGYAQPGGYPQAGAQGYAQPGYAQPGASGSYAQPGYVQPGAPGAYAQGGYPQAGAANAAAQVPGGSYIPQTPYSPGYTQTGGYSQTYNAYGQMGRGQQIPVQQPVGQTPLNGGGYVPPPMQVRRRPFALKDAELLVIGAVLVVLFAAGMFVPGLGVLRWVFLALAAGTTALLWLKPLTEQSRRLCFTIVFALLAVVTAVGLFTGGSSPRSGGSSPEGGADATRTSVSSQQQQGASAASSQDIYTDNGQAVNGSAPTSAPTPEPEPDSAVTDRLESFFYYWSANRYDDMLALCSPTWASKQEKPSNALFTLLANRTPKDYAVEKISGTSEDTSRTVTINSEMDPNNGKKTVRYRMSIIMIRESDGLWYLDPQSLKTYENAETPDPSITDTPAPTNTPEVLASTKLYYNPKGGSFYHLDRNCQRIDKSYLPLKGEFTYGQLSEEPYCNLSPCAICGAPLPGQ